MQRHDTTKVIHPVNDTVFDPHICRSIPVWAIIYCALIIYAFCKVLLELIE